MAGVDVLLAAAAFQNQMAGNNIPPVNHMQRNSTQPTNQMAGNNVQHSNQMAGNNVQHSNQMAGNNVQHSNQMAGNNVQHSNQMTGNNVQHSNQMTGNNVQHSNQMAGNNVQHSNQMAGKNIQPMIQMAGYNAQLLNQMAGNNAQPSTHTAGNNAQPSIQMAGNNVQQLNHSFSGSSSSSDRSNQNQEFISSLASSARATSGGVGQFFTTLVQNERPTANSATEIRSEMPSFSLRPGHIAVNDLRLRTAPNLMSIVTNPQMLAAADVRLFPSGFSFAPGFQIRRIGTIIQHQPPSSVSSPTLDCNPPPPPPSQVDPQQDPRPSRPAQPGCRSRRVCRPVPRLLQEEVPQDGTGGEKRPSWRVTSQNGGGADRHSKQPSK